MHADHLEAEIDRIVEEAIGFYGFPGSKTPWQRIMSHTRKAIAQEDNLSRINEASSTDKKTGVNPMELLVAIETHKIGMQPWVDIYPARDGGENRTWSIDKLDLADVPPIRAVRDIVKHTINQDEADRHLNVFNPKHGQVYSKTGWKKARKGWNKHERQYVVFLDGWPKTCSSHAKRHRLDENDDPVIDADGNKVYWPLQRAVPRYYFGIILTVWLLAMAPHAKNRVLVIRQAISRLMGFYNDNQKISGAWNRGTTGPPPMFDGGNLNEWYAFHTLRRMFYMRTGCRMCQHEEDGEWVETPEPSGSLYDFDPQKDKAFMLFKQQEAARLKKMRKSTAGH